MTSVVGDVLYSAEDGRLRALDARSGERLASVRTDGLPTGPPAVGGGTLFLGTDSGTLYAIVDGETSVVTPGLGIGGGLATLGGYAAYRYRGRRSDAGSVSR